MIKSKYDRGEAWRGVAWCGAVWREARRGEARHGQENEERERNCGGVYLTCVVVSGGGKGGSVCAFGGGLAGSAFECGGGMVWWCGMGETSCEHRRWRWW